MPAVVAAAAAAAAGAVPRVPLRNAAAAGETMPMMGLGTGGYAFSYVPAGVYPECWTDDAGPPYGGPADCQTPRNATVAWLAAGGERIDNGDSYQNQKQIQAGIVQSGRPRSQVYIVTKTGNGLAMGYNETLQQVDDVLANFNTAYLDLVLIHWPQTGAKSTDPACAQQGKACRLSTWQAHLELLRTGKARAVGVSNYNVDHLQEIIDAGLQLPAVNQCPYNPHLAKAQAALLAKCNKLGIVFNSYSPLGIPDFHKYAPEVGTELLLDEPTVKAIAAAHGKTPAQVLINWQWSLGMPSNPRTASASHMKENLDSFDFKITEAEAAQLAAMPQDSCKHSNWYECCGGSQKSIPTCG